MTYSDVIGNFKCSPNLVFWGEGVRLVFKLGLGSSSL